MDENLPNSIGWGKEGSDSYRRGHFAGFAGLAGIASLAGFA